MFKNFDKVFRFSFRNQAGTGSFKAVTVVIAVLMFLLPPVIMLIVAFNSNKDDSLKPCNAERIYVADLTGMGRDFFGGLKDLPEEDYKNIEYKIFDDFDSALKASEKDTSCFILLVDNKDELKTSIVIPTDSTVTKKDSKNYFKFIKKYSDVFTLGFSGISSESLAELSKQSEYKTYTATGYYEKGISIDEDTEKNDSLIRDQVMKVFGMALPYGTIILLYFLLLTYGQTLAQSVVMEKETKLMDTMLVSVKPESLIFGKLLSSILTVILQVFIWIASLIAGFVVGNILSKVFYPDNDLSISVFFRGLKELGVFRPVNIVITCIFLILGLVVYLSLAAIAGAMSNNKEEVSSRSSLFIFPLLISFLAVIFTGGINAETTKAWMLILPFTGAMLMPADVALGTVGWGIIAASLVCFVVFVLVFVIAAGRIYKMMSLYKGNQISVGEVLKRAFSRDL
ncbi:MAG: ABC transporter permease [Lachnospiraceae bacterium]|nr:ABC transporter permease [Lachnospiraceae bacterium]